jgi:chloride channel 7
VNELLDAGHFGTMWFVAVLISMTLAFGSAVIIVYGEPSAGGSGIPDVMAYLNGVSIRRVSGAALVAPEGFLLRWLISGGGALVQIFGAKALVCKFFSCIFAVSAGLYGGQEGKTRGLRHVNARY